MSRATGNRTEPWLNIDLSKNDLELMHDALKSADRTGATSAHNSRNISYISLAADTTPSSLNVKNSRSLLQRAFANSRSDIPSAQRTTIKLEITERDYFDQLTTFTPSEHDSWDDVSGETGNRDFERRTLLYDDEMREAIVNATVNASIGFTTPFHTNVSKKLEVIPEVKRATFGPLLEKFAISGNLLRALSLAAMEIRSMNDRNQSPTAYAVAAAIESEIRDFQVGSMVLKSSQYLLSVIRKLLPERDDIFHLATILGCTSADFKISKVPQATKLISRAYKRALLTKSDLYQRVFTTCLTPWIAQLNNALGLGTGLDTSSNKCKLKEEFFPELFIGVVDDDGYDDDQTFFVIEDEIPIFLDVKTARSVLFCLDALHILGSRSITSRVRPIEVSIPPDRRLKFAMVPKMDEGLKLFERAKDAEKLEPLRYSTRLEPCVSSARRFARHLTRTINCRAAELDSQLKTQFMNDLCELRTVVFDLYFLQDGVVWSHMSGLVPYLPDGKTDEVIPRLSLINELVKSHFGAGVGILVKNGKLVIDYHPPHLGALVGNHLLYKCGLIFTRLVSFYQERLLHDFNDLVTELEAIRRRVECSLSSSASGMKEVTSAFNRLFNIRTD